MKYCKTCHLFYTNEQIHCLFCNNTLEPASQETQKEPVSDSTINAEVYYPYPAYQKKKNVSGFLTKLVTLLCAATILICFFVDLTTNHGKLSWSFLIFVIMLYSYLVFHSIMGYRLFIHKLTSICIETILLLLFIGLYTGNSNDWSTDYVFPLLLLAFGIVTLAFLILSKKRRSDFYIYVMSISFINIVPFILYVCNVLHILWPALTCFCYGLFTLIALFIFAPKEARQEIVRRFHI